MEVFYIGLQTHHILAVQILNNYAFTFGQPVILICDQLVGYAVVDDVFGYLQTAMATLSDKSQWFASQRLTLFARLHELSLPHA